MAEKRIVLFTGMKQHQLTVNYEYSLATFRQHLYDTGIIERDGTKGHWRFVSKVIKLEGNNNIAYTDSVVAIGTEDIINLIMFMRRNDALYMADVNRNVPDLCGMKTTRYKNDSVECFIRQNDKITNNKFEPIMLERVRALKKVSTVYNNVLVCEEDTAIKIWITAKGHSGFGYSIESGTGESIVKKLYVHNDDPEKEVWVAQTRYQEKDEAIVVSSIPGTVNDEDRFRYHRLSIKVWRLDSLVENGSTVTINHSATRSAREVQEINPYILPGDTISHATVTPGKATNDEPGIISNVNDDKGDFLGIIELDLFIFKSIADANAVIEMNVMVSGY